MHLSCNAEGAPYVVPMNYGFALAPDGRLTLYLHCAAEGRKLDLLRRDARVGFAISALVETVRARPPLRLDGALPQPSWHGPAPRF